MWEKTQKNKTGACRVQTCPAVVGKITWGPWQIWGAARNKPCSGVVQTAVYRCWALHSAAVAAPELCADVVQRHDVLAQLEVVRELVRTGEVGQEVNDVLLLAGKVCCKLLAALLELLLSSELDYLWALLYDVLCRSLALAGEGLALCLTLHDRRGLSGGALELVNTLHVVEKVVAAREAVAWHCTLAVLEVAEVRPGTVSVHTVRLALVTEQARCGGELNADASLLVATERLQVRVDVLVVVAFQRCRLVSTARLALLGAVVLAVLVRTPLVEDVAASNLGALLLELSLSGINWGLDVLRAMGDRSGLFNLVPNRES
jgi:hypothetical protein